MTALAARCELGGGARQHSRFNNCGEGPRSPYSLPSRAREGSETSSGKYLLAKLPTGLRGLEIADLLTHGSVLNRNLRRVSIRANFRH
jgi:hypothetical protein